MTTFFRLLSIDDKGDALLQAVRALQEGCPLTTTFVVAADSFGQVPGSAFSYWVSEELRSIFKQFPAFEFHNLDVERGATTMNDFRYLRGWWEVSPTASARDRMTTQHSGRWVLFAKGGAFAQYYGDLDLVIDWEQDGSVLKEEVTNYRGSHGWGYHWTAAINGHAFYFREGITFSNAATTGFSTRILPLGCIFSHMGPSVFAPDSARLPRVLALMNSKAFEGLLALRLGMSHTGRKHYEVGVIQRTPVPDLDNPDGERLGELAMQCVHLKRDLDTANETSHVFHLPALLQAEGDTLAGSAQAWQRRVDAAHEQLARNQAEIDNIAFRLYGISDQDRRAMEESLGGPGLPVDEAADALNADVNAPTEEDEVDEVAQPPVDTRSLVADLLSYLVGCALGRWDMRFATGERPKPALHDPFAPLPVCSPGMLVGEDGLPTREAPPGYPLEMDSDGILVDDPDHQDDIVRRVQAVMRAIWGDAAAADEIEAEMCTVLSVPALRDYFRRGFFEAHIKRYSKSRRKAPIYWLLQSERKGYGIWLYYHLLDRDMLFKALALYTDHKLTGESLRLDQVRAAQRTAATSPSGGKEARRLAREVDKQEGFVSELNEFREKLSAAAHLGLAPDLNDGVLLNIAPLHALMPWRETRRVWEDIQAGKYPWSTIGKRVAGDNLR